MLLNHQMSEEKLRERNYTGENTPEHITELFLHYVISNTLKKLNEEMRTAYSDIMSNEHMKAYNDAKQAFDKVVQRVQAIVQQSADGEDPDTTDFSEDCTHDCSTCGGCG